MENKLCEKFCGKEGCKCMQTAWFETYEDEKRAHHVGKVFLTLMAGVLIVVTVLFILTLFL
jgi:hypothetical protein